MENLAHLVFWQNKKFQTGTSLISTSLNTKTTALCKSISGLVSGYPGTAQSLQVNFCLQCQCECQQPHPKE